LLEPFFVVNPIVFLFQLFFNLISKILNLLGIDFGKVSIMGVIKTFLFGIVGVIKLIFIIVKAVMFAARFLLNLFIGLIGGLNDALNFLRNSIVKGLVRLFTDENARKNFFSNFTGAFLDWAKSVWNGMVSAFRDRLSSVTQIISVLIMYFEIFVLKFQKFLKEKLFGDFFIEKSVEEINKEILELQNKIKKEQEKMELESPSNPKKNTSEKLNVFNDNQQKNINIKADINVYESKNAKETAEFVSDELRGLLALSGEY